LLLLENVVFFEGIVSVVCDESAVAGVEYLEKIKAEYCGEWRFS
jgi:hypothetical protein